MKLYDYQERAVEKASGLEGFLNADDMGTGKTVMLLEEPRRLAQSRPVKVLIVTIKSAISVWEDHVAMMMPDFEVYVPRKKMTEEELTAVRSRSKNVAVIVNWAQLRINPDLQRFKFTFVIADEAQALSNRKSQQRRAARRLKAEFRRAGTGTPIINAPHDLWGILNWLYPKRFTSYWTFYEEFCDYIEEYGQNQKKFKVVTGVRNSAKLREILMPIAIRRKKKTVMPELPDKYYTRIKVDLDPKQRRAYKQMTDDALAWVGSLEDEAIPAPIAIAKLTRLRQFCVAHATAYETTCPKCKGTGRFGGDDLCPRCKGSRTIIQVELQEPSSKLDAVMEIVNSTDESVVVFSQFSQVIDLLEARLKKSGVTYARVTGDVTGANRRIAIERFQSGDARVFISTIKAGGVGITLTRASTVVFVDRSYSPADNDQAEDRLHRKGQTNAVQVITIEARNTVDQEVEETLQFKRSMIREILGD